MILQPYLNYVPVFQQTQNGRQTRFQAILQTEIETEYRLPQQHTRKYNLHFSFVSSWYYKNWQSYVRLSVKITWNHHNFDLWPATVEVREWIELFR